MDSFEWTFTLIGIFLCFPLGVLKLVEVLKDDSKHWSRFNAYLGSVMIIVGLGSMVKFTIYMYMPSVAL